MECLRKGIWNTTPKLLFPKRNLNELPIICDIVTSLLERDFRVDNVVVNFRFNGYGMDIFKNVSNIIYGNINIWFCKQQGELPGYENSLFDSSGVLECHIKGHSLIFDSSVYYYYVGTDWEKDIESFRKLQFQENPLIRQKEKYISSKAFEIFNADLKVFLDYINSFPITDKRDFTNSLCETIEDFELRKFEPYPSNYPTFCVVDDPFPYNRKTIIKNFKKGFDNLCLQERVITFESTERLVALGSNKENIPIHPLSYEDFLLVSLFESDDLCFGKCSNNDDRLICAIRPHYLDEIYVADLSISMDYRRSCFQNDDTKQSLSNSEYDMYITLRGVSVVTLKEYIEKSMCFKKPQYLIRNNSRIGYDEVMKIYYKEGGIVKMDTQTTETII